MLYTCVCVCAGVHTCYLCAHLWRPKVDIRSVPLPFFILFRQGYIIEPRAHGLAKLTGQEALGSSCLCLSALGFYTHTPQFLSFYLDSGDLNWGSCLCLHRKHLVCVSIQFLSLNFGWARVAGRTWVVYAVGREYYQVWHQLDSCWWFNKE